MTPPDHHVPGARLAADQAGAAQIDRILARRRSELARLGLAARSAVRRRDEAEAQLIDHRDGYEGGDAPGDLLAVVDSMIERTVRACDEALADARHEAEETLALAVDEGRALLRQAGLADSQLATDPRPWGDRHVVSPPSAADLWRRVGAGRLATPADSVPADPDRGRTVPQRHGAHTSEPSMWAPLDVAVSVPASSLPSPDSFTDLRPAAVATLVAPEAGTEEQTDDERSAAAFETFWQEAGRDRRARGRFLRRGAKEDS